MTERGRMGMVGGALGLLWFGVLLMPPESRQFLAATPWLAPVPMAVMMVASAIASALAMPMLDRQSFRWFVGACAAIPALGAVTFGLIFGLYAWVSGLLAILIQGGSIGSAVAWIPVGVLSIPVAVYAAIVMLGKVLWVAVPTGVAHSYALRRVGRSRARGRVEARPADSAVA